jgi:hypothetical protein
MRELTVEEIGRLDEVSGGSEFCGTDPQNLVINQSMYLAYVASGYDVCGTNSSDFNSMMQAGIWGGAGYLTSGGYGAAAGGVAGFLGSFSWTLVT